MSTGIPTRESPVRYSETTPRLGESKLSAAFLMVLAFSFLGFFLILPLAAVFVEAFKKGWHAYLAAIQTPDTQAAIKLSLLAVFVAVPLNTFFGLAAAWVIARFKFPGKGILNALIELPFSVSPVIAGLIFVLLLGRQGWWGPWLDDHNIQILFAPPGIILATIFVTFPFVARQVTPLLEAQGKDEEEAALTLGASGFITFVKITLPKAKWAIFHGVVLTLARAMGEFGAVSVVSGHIRGVTNTLPLHIEVLFNDYQMAAAFSVASLLTLLALVTLGMKSITESRARRDLANR